MGAGLISFKMAAWLLAVIVGLLLVVGFYTDSIHFAKDGYKCYHGNHWYKTSESYRWFSLGSLHLTYTPRAYGCQNEERYDPSKYQLSNGILEPLEP